MSLRVLIAEDSVTVRKYLVELLTEEQGFEVVGEACDGHSAVEMCQRLRPDVVTMDMVMPKMGGLAATEQIMGHCPTPILVISSSFNRAELVQTCEALAAGAVDVLEKPRPEESSESWERKLFSALRVVSKVKVITHLRARLEENGRTARAFAEGNPSGKIQVVAVGASTGGPTAVVDVLRRLPPDFPLPVLLVLHLGEAFGGAFATWLTEKIGRSVRFPQAGELLSKLGGTVLMAPPGYHMVVKQGRIQLNREPERHSCRPSVDVLFESLARDCGPQVLACLLTGMGRDGARGLLQLRQAGALTIAQNEASCVVYGMPREAVALGAAQQVLALEEIGGAIVRLAARG